MLKCSTSVLAVVVLITSLGCSAPRSPAKQSSAEKRPSAPATVSKPATRADPRPTAPAGAVHMTRRPVAPNPTPPPPATHYDLVLNDLKFVYFADGSAVLGSPENEPGRNAWESQRFAMLYDGFYLLRTEVTAAQYARYADSPAASPRQHGDLPVTDVSWDEAVAFCQRLTEAHPGYRFRLPTEVEWEYACRAGESLPFSVPFEDRHELETALVKQAAGDDEFLDRFVGQYAHFNTSLPEPVASARPNAAGLYDMHGNVWEWCLDDGLVDPDLRPIRGGAWSSPSVWGCRAAVRSEEYRETRKSSIGFRVVAHEG